MFAENTGVFTGTAAALGTVTGARARSIVFKVVTSGAETVSITGTIRGSTVSSQIMCYNLATGALHSSVNMDDGTYFLPLIFTDDLIFLGSAGSDTKTVTFRIGD